MPYTALPYKARHFGKKLVNKENIDDNLFPTDSLMKICPACNGLTQLSITCPFCQQSMTDNGFVADFFGPYSPYMDEDSYELASLWSPGELAINSPEPEDPVPCIHLMACSKCGWDTRIAVPKVSN